MPPSPSQLRRRYRVPGTIAPGRSRMVVGSRRTAAPCGSATLGAIGPCGSDTGGLGDQAIVCPNIVVVPPNASPCEGMRVRCKHCAAWHLRCTEREPTTMQILTSLVVFALDSTPPPAPPASTMRVVIAPAEIEGDLPELDRAAVQDALERGLAAPGLALIDGAQQCETPPCPTPPDDAHRVEMNVVAGARTYEVELRAYRPDQPDAYATANGRCEICGLAELEQL